MTYTPGLRCKISQTSVFGRINKRISEANKQTNGAERAQDHHRLAIEKQSENKRSTITRPRLRKYETYDAYSHSCFKLSLIFLAKVLF